MDPFSSQGTNTPPDIVIPILDTTSLTYDLDDSGSYGFYGVTRKAILHLKDGSQARVAVKQIYRTNYSENSIRKQARILKSLNLAGGAPRFYGITSEKDPSLVMELCLGPTLEEYLQSNPHANGIRAIKQLRAALEEFHRAGFSHGDLHEGNVIIETDLQTSEVNIHLIDMGCAEAINKDQEEQDKISLERMSKRVEERTWRRVN